MTAPLASSILAVLFALAGYAAGRYHQWHRSTGDREDAYQEGYETATASTFSMAARIASPATPAAMPADPPIATQSALATSAVPASAPIPAPGELGAGIPAPGWLGDAHGPGIPRLGRLGDAHGPGIPAPGGLGDAHDAGIPASGQLGDGPSADIPAPGQLGDGPSADIPAPGQLGDGYGSRIPAGMPASAATDMAADFAGGVGQERGLAAASGSAGRAGGSEGEGAAALSPIADSAVGMPLGHRHMGHGAPRDEGFPAPTPYELDDAVAGRREAPVEREDGAGRSGAFFEPVERDSGRAAEAPVPRAGRAAEAPVPRVERAAEAPVPRVGRRGRHYVPDELVQATTYRLPADRVARAKVPDTIKPPEDGDEYTGGTQSPVPRPRSS